MIIVVIPAYKPGEKLLWVATEILEQTEYSVLVVNDGSGSAYDSIFAGLPEQVTVLCHDVNRGKGAALKTAYAYIKTHTEYTGVITADADGQHLVRDIIRIGGVFAQGTRTSILKYYIVAVALLFLNYGFLWVFSAVLPIPLAAAKIITELLLYPLSYVLQRRFVFVKRAEKAV